MRPPRWRLPARTRLTLWYVLLLSGTCLLLGGLALWLVERTLYLNADEVLRSKTAAVQSETDVSKGQLSFSAPKAPNSRIPVVAAGLDVVRIWDRDGRLIYHLEIQTGTPQTDAAAINAMLSDRESFASLPTDGTNIRVYGAPVRDKDKIVGAMQVGRSEADIQAILNRLKLLGAVGLALALILACAGGHFLAGRALAPVDRITRAAERINAEDLSQRLPVPLPGDELGRLTRAFNGMIERLESAFERQRQFTADASHELRTPLAIIRAQAEAARARPREPRSDADVLDAIHEESIRLGHIVEDLLFLARADAGEPFSPVQLDLEELVSDVSEQIALRAHDRGIELVVEVDETAPVVGDATWLKQLLLNLFDNALRHTPSGGRVVLTSKPALDGVELTIADNGEGIAPEHQPRLFERFYRADQARSRSAGGTGLGLAICDWVARVHGGRLTVQSELGRGSAFVLWLPAASPANGGGPPRQTALSASTWPLSTCPGPPLAMECGRPASWRTEVRPKIS